MGCKADYGSMKMKRNWTGKERRSLPVESSKEGSVSLV